MYGEKHFSFISKKSGKNVKSLSRNPDRRQFVSIVLNLDDAVHEGEFDLTKDDNS